MDEVVKKERQGLKIIRSPYEDDVIAWFKINGETILQVKNRLKNEKKYSVSYTCISNYFHKVLPTVTEDRVNEISKKLNINRIDKESILITKLTELENSIDYLRRLGTNIETTNSAKNRFIEIKRLKEQNLLETIALFDNEKDTVAKDKLKIEIELLNEDISRCDMSVLSFMNMENKTTRLQQDIRTDINKVLGETWQAKIQQIIDTVVKGIFDILNPYVADEKREETKKRIRECVEKMYLQYGVKLK